MRECRFCGSAPYYPTHVKKNKSLTSCSNNKCPIFGIQMTVKQWEAPSPQEIELDKVITRLETRINMINNMNKRF